jgi:hypothetical protein
MPKRRYERREPTQWNSSSLSTSAKHPEGVQMSSPTDPIEWFRYPFVAAHVSCPDLEEQFTRGTKATSRYSGEDVMTAKETTHAS